MKTIKQIAQNPSTIFVDVRSPWEFDIDHLPGAKNIPLEEVTFKVEDFKKMGQPLLLYCRSGNRSGMAVNILKQHGVPEVYNGGGLNDLRFLLN